MPNHIRFILLYLFLLIATPAMSSPYHSDHLGSATWITDAQATPVQYIHYAPYGELIANQMSDWYDERYKYTERRECSMATCHGVCLRHTYEKSPHVDYTHVKIFTN